MNQFEFSYQIHVLDLEMKFQEFIGKRHCLLSYHIEMLVQMTAHAVNLVIVDIINT